MIPILFMLFVFIHWWPTQFPYHTKFMSSKSNMKGITSGAGTPTLPEYQSSSLNSNRGLCRSIFSFLGSVLSVIVCLFLLFLFAIVLSVLQIMASDCPFSIFKLFKDFLLFILHVSYKVQFSLGFSFRGLSGSLEISIVTSHLQVF